MTRRENNRNTNGHASPNGRANGSAASEHAGVVTHHGRPPANGHAPASMWRGGIPARRNRAASDDTSGVPVASAASSAAAGADREAYAEVAPPRPNGEARNLSQKTPTAKPENNEQRPVPPGQYPLPEDPAEFVEEIHRKIDLTEVWHDLLRSKDEKVKQRAVERLTDLLYKVAGGGAEEPQQVLFDLPRPKRD